MTKTAAKTPKKAATDAPKKAAKRVTAAKKPSPTAAETKRFLAAQQFIDDFKRKYQ